jgi:hypothetical protein
VGDNNYHFSVDSSTFRRSEHSLGSIASSPSTKGSVSSVSQLSQSLIMKPIEENEVTVETPCTPFLTLINASSSETKQQWNLFVAELRHNPVVMADMLSII